MGDKSNLKDDIYVSVAEVANGTGKRFFINFESLRNSLELLTSKSRGEYYITDNNGTNESIMTDLANLQRMNPGSFQTSRQLVAFSQKVHRKAISICVPQCFL